MLPDVSDDKNSVVWIELAEKRPHLFCTGKAGLIQHIETLIGRIGTWAILTPGEEALQGRGINPCLAELSRCLGCWGKSLDDIPARFRAFANSREDRGFSRSGKPLKAVDTVG